MKKPTQQQIEQATDEQLAEWSAVWVMGWKPCGGKCCWFEKGNNSLIRTKGTWNPAQNIGQAWELVEKINGCLHLREHGGKGVWEAQFCVCYAVAHDEKASRAITKAALMAGVGV